MPTTGKRIARTLSAALLDNLGLKLLALALATFLFSLVRGAEDAQRSIYVDVVALPPRDAAQKMLLTELPERVKLTIRGSRAQLNTIRREEMDPVQIDLRDTSRRYYDFESASFGLPAGVTIVDISPSFVPLSWADVAVRLLRVETQLTGTLPPGLTFASRPTVEPPETRVRGPAHELEVLSQIETDPIDVRELGPGSHVRWVALRRPSEHATLLGAPTVRVTLEVRAELSQRRLSRVPVTVLRTRAQARPAVVAVVLRGSALALNAVDDEAIDVIVDGGDGALLAPREAPVRVANVPAGVEIERIEPPIVSLWPVRGR